MAPGTFRVPVPFFSVVQHTYLFSAGGGRNGLPIKPGKKIIVNYRLKHNKMSYLGKSTATSWRQLEPSHKWSTRVTLVMAEGEATTFGSFSESDSNSILSGSVIRLTSQKTAKRNWTFQRRLVVKYYCIVSNQRDAPGPIVSLKTKLQYWQVPLGKRIGNTDWYVTKMYFVAFSSPCAYSYEAYSYILFVWWSRCTCNHC